MTDSPVSCTIDLSAPGKQLGRLQLPKITNTGGWASTFIPIASIANGDGPNVLVLAGNHGDEYEGQVAGLRLIQELEPEQVSGRVTVIPVLSTGASKANTRLWPSGVNFNRSFPGSPDGPPNEQLADYLTRFLFPPADVVIDMHSGGRTAWFVPCSHMHVVDDAEQRRAMLAGMQAWNSDYHFLYIDVNGTGLLPVEAEDQGKLVITTELGGGGRVPARRARARLERPDERAPARRPARGRGADAGSLGKPDAVILDGRDPANYVIAPEDGIFEGLLEPPATGAGRRPGRAPLVPGHARPAARGAARAARRRARCDPLDSGNGGGRRSLHDRPADRSARARLT